MVHKAFECGGVDLRDVLVQRLGAVVDALIVAPSEVGWERRRGDVILWKRVDRERSLMDEAGSFGLFFGPNLSWTASVCKSHSGGENNDSDGQFHGALCL